MGQGPAEEARIATALTEFPGQQKATDSISLLYAGMTIYTNPRDRHSNDEKSAKVEKRAHARLPNSLRIAKRKPRVR